MRLRQVATEIYVDDAIREYIVRLVEATRHNEKITVGSSMRGALALTRCARIWAAADGRAYVVPDDVKDLAVAVLAHRITLTPEATFDGATPESLIAQVLEDVPPHHRFLIGPGKVSDHGIYIRRITPSPAR